MTQVQSTLYKLDSRTLAWSSRMFHEMFSMPQPSGITVDGNTGDVEGTEDKPIFVPNVNEPEFDIFVAQSYGM